MQPSTLAPAFRCAGLVLLLAASGPAQEAPAWPFGASGASGRGLDAWNLGLLGAKAVDADAEPAPEPASGRRVVSRAPEPRGDPGPARLKVMILHPQGPAARAGLAIGDVIVGVNGASFEKGSLDPLARALVKAEGAAKGRLVLRLEAAEPRGKPRDLMVPIPPGGKDMQDPVRPAARLSLGCAALDWLAARQQDDGGFPQTLSGSNGAVVQACVAGLAWLAGGSLPGKGRHGKNLDQALKFVLRHVDDAGAFGGRSGAGPSWDQSNWGYAHAAIFLGEVQARAPSGLVLRELARIAKLIGERQEASGGWAHGPGGPNALGYVELNIVTGLSLIGLGLARQAGCEVDAEVIRKADVYLQESSSGGGVGYSANPGQKGIGNIGRSAAVCLGYRLLGLGRTSFGGHLDGYVAQNTDDLLDGHASLMQHILLAGLAGQVLGGQAESRFWQAAARSLVLARAPDGSFQPRPWSESLSMSSNSDVSFGEVWTTAAWACVLLCDPELKGAAGLPGLFGTASRKSG